MLQRSVTATFCALALSILTVVATAHQRPAGADTQAAAHPPATPKSTASASISTQLEPLARQLRDSNRSTAAGAYTRLSALARRWSGVERSRAALALGHYEYMADHATASRDWFRQARNDPVLAGYALYWEGLAASAAGQDTDAMTLLEQFRQQYPQSVMTEPAIATFADAAIDAKQPDRALALLHAYPETVASARLLFRQAKAEEKASDFAAAARDYQAVYDKFPLSSDAAEAEQEIDRLRHTMVASFVEAPMVEQLARAEILYLSGHWKDAIQAYQRLLDSLSGPDHDRAALRIAECDAKMTRNAGALETLTLSDPQLDAERLVDLAGAYRARNDEDRMVAAVEQAVQRDPAGAWAGDALFLAGNYYWANLKRDRAVEFYRRLLQHSAGGQDAVNADWRIAWTAYLENKPEAKTLLDQHVQRFPQSPNVPDALFWLGRLAEKAGDLPTARAYYRKVSERFVGTYFGRSARERLEQIGSAPLPETEMALLAVVPALSPAKPLADDIPAAAREAYERAEALTTVAFDESALAELRNAYHATGAAELLIAAARSAQAADHYLTGAALARQLFPDLESRPADDIPAEIWRIVYPLPSPFASLIRVTASRYHLDPMVLAALIRQESGFEADAISSAGAVGLAQLEPRTARKWSRTLHLRYSLKRLTDPSYNLRVAGAYFQELIQDFGSAEAALAAYNAGEDRVAAWRADTHFNDPAEFVESIPFSQTHHYVQVILDGAVIYRRLYEAQP